MQITDLIYIDDTGYHFADYPTILAWLQDQYKAIYGADVYLGSDSQDGQWIAVQAKAIYDSAAIGASTYNSFSPATAQGLGLSRVVKINGLRRGVPTNSQADLTIVGQAGTTITNGVAIDTLEQKWDLPASVTIPGGGTIVVTALAQELGDISAVATSINRIFTPTLGWQTVNNVADATPGAPIEADATLRIRQTVSVADPSLTVFDGTIGGVSNLTGVTKVRGYENDTGSTDGNGIPAHSISIVVLGGDSQEIAQEIALHKTPGTRTYGTTTELVYDAHGMPLNINFYRPSTANIDVNITLVADVGWSDDYIPLIQQSVADAITAGQIGATIYLTKLFNPAYLTGNPAGMTYDITVLETQKNGGGFSGANITLLFNENPVCLAADVVVTVM